MGINRLISLQPICLYPLKMLKYWKYFPSFFGGHLKKRRPQLLFWGFVCYLLNKSVNMEILFVYLFIFTFETILDAFGTNLSFF